MPDYHNPSSVLIIGENPETLVLIAFMLENAGFRTLLARTSGEAFQIAARQYVPIDAVVCDVLVGGESGAAIVRGLKQIRPWVREVYMSGVVDSEAIHIRVMSQINPGTFEPSTELVLAAAVRTALGRGVMRAGAS